MEFDCQQRRRFFATFKTDFALALDFDPEEVFDTYYNAKLKSEIQGNYMKIDVYFQTLNVREIVQKKKYSADTFTAALGGGLSLYLGVALILLFEIVELGYDVFIAVWNHINKSSRSSAAA